MWYLNWCGIDQSGEALAVVLASGSGRAGGTNPLVVRVMEIQGTWGEDGGGEGHLPGSGWQPPPNSLEVFQYL